MTALEWEGCVNVRDLGGLETEAGGSTRLGTVVRSDNVRKLSDAGWRALAAHGVTRIVDLRWPEELAEDSPSDVDIDVVHVSVLGDSWSSEFVQELDAHLLSAADAEEHYAWSYVEFLERFRDRFGRALAAVADAEGAVVVHCAGGKDRTGLMSALLLRLAGVPREMVAADYALSGPNLAESTRAWIDAAPDERERRKRELLAPTPAEAMRRVLEEVERRYGGVEEYMRAAGLDDAQIARLRDRLAAA